MLCSAIHPCGGDVPHGRRWPKANVIPKRQIKGRNLQLVDDWSIPGVRELDHMRRIWILRAVNVLECQRRCIHHGKFGEENCHGDVLIGPCRLAVTWNVLLQPNRWVLLRNVQRIICKLDNRWRICIGVQGHICLAFSVATPAVRLLVHIQDAGMDATRAQKSGILRGPEIQTILSHATPAPNLGALGQPAGEQGPCGDAAKALLTSRAPLLLSRHLELLVKVIAPAKHIVLLTAAQGLHRTYCQNGAAVPVTTSHLLPAHISVVQVRNLSPAIALSTPAKDAARGVHSTRGDRSSSYLAPGVSRWHYQPVVCGGAPAQQLCCFCDATSVRLSQCELLETVSGWDVTLALSCATPAKCSTFIGDAARMGGAALHVLPQKSLRYIDLWPFTQRESPCQWSAVCGGG
mmetsp:Transcript_80692/g.193551  ORF Transcript_80692/g.193551 Transcript_80692/m.193551 type:complete len:405 (-) Transcript_80692:173-1387(-)